MKTSASSPRSRALLLTALLATFGIASFQIVRLTVGSQPLGVDFSPLWTGARVALQDPQRLYDFEFVSQLQGPWAQANPRPFVYPPSALFFFAPFTALPVGAAFLLWSAATGAAFTAAARRAGASAWLWAFPVVWLVALVGQVTFAVGALVIAGLTLRNRSLVAGVLFGLAACLKPQALVFLPVGLIAARSWRTLLAAGVTGALVCAGSAAIWGPGIWLDWLQAVHRFNAFIEADPRRWLRYQVSASAALQMVGLPSALALALIPAAAWLVWATFRASDDPLIRAAAALGGALLVSPYAMDYDATLLAPAIVAGMWRTKNRIWLLHVLLGFGFAFSVMVPIGLTVTGLASPLVMLWSRRLSRKEQRPLGLPADLEPMQNVAARIAP